MMHFNKMTIYVYFCNNVVFFEGKKLIKAVSSDTAETDRYASNNERSKTFKNFIVNLWFNSQYLLNSNALMASW